MADVKLKNKNGEETTFNGVETITVPTEDGGETTFYNSPPKTLQSKTQTFSSNVNNALLRPDNGYDGLSEVTTSVFVIPPFNTYRFLSPETEPTNPSESEYAFTILSGHGDNPSAGSVISAMFSNNASVKPLIIVVIINGTSSFEITDKTDYNCVFYAFEEIDSTKLATFPNVAFTFGEGVTIPQGWTYGIVENDTITNALTSITASDTVKISANATIHDDYFKSLFTYASEKDITVELSMKNGDQILSPAEGEGFHKVTITKPSTLVPENIKYGVNIGGVVGTNNNNAMYADFSSVDGVISMTQRNATMLVDYLKNKNAVCVAMFFQGESVSMYPLLVGAWGSTEDNLATKIRLISNVGYADFSSTEVTTAGYIIIDGVLDEAATTLYNFAFSITKAVQGTEDVTEMVKLMPYTLRVFVNNN